MRKRKAYTLLEVLVVLAIMGILLTLIGTQSHKALLAQQETQISTDLLVIASAAKIYYLDRTDKDETNAESLYQEGYLQRLPESPIKDYGYHVGYHSKRDEVTVSLEKGGRIYEKGDFKGQLSL